MTLGRLFLLAVPALVAACASGTIAQLDNVKIDLKDEEVSGGLETALQSYRLDPETMPESEMAPEFILRLADLKVEREFDFAASTSVLDGEDRKALLKWGDDEIGNTDREEGMKEASSPVSAKQQKQTAPSRDAQEAIVLYKKLLNTYPQYERNDHALYQLARIYEELGKSGDAMKTLDRLTAGYPRSRYIEEAQFRRGEHYYSRRKFPEAKGAYQAIVDAGAKSPYYEFALYKLGWTYYKQEMYEQGVRQFIALLEYKSASGYDPDMPVTEKRIEDTYRAVSMSFSYLGGSDAVAAYFGKYGGRRYEADVYKDMGNYYLEKRRYSDAAATFKAFSRNNPGHKMAPYFDMWVTESYRKGGFPKLVIESNEDFLNRYGVKAPYWSNPEVIAAGEATEYARNVVMEYAKSVLKDLASYYHAQYQDKHYAENRDENFRQAMKWYREFLASFPKETDTPAVHYRLAELLLENNEYSRAAAEFEYVAFEYPVHEKSAGAGYMAVYALRKNIAAVALKDAMQARRELISKSLKFAEAFHKDEKAALVLSAAVEDMYALKDYELAAMTARKLLVRYALDQDARRATWLIFAQSSFELGHYKDAEEGYLTAQGLMPKNDASIAALNENLAATFYKTGEQLNARGEYNGAATYFLLVGKYAPATSIRPIADFDGATALMQLKDWDEAENVLISLRSGYPKHELQPEVTKKLAFIYNEKGQLPQAAAEYERIGMETGDMAVRREAWEIALDMYGRANEEEKLYPVYRRYVDNFREPLEQVLEMRNKIAQHAKSHNDMESYYLELRKIVDADAGAGARRADRVRYLGAMAAVGLAGQEVARFTEIRLVKPFDANLQKKKGAMKGLKEQLDGLFGYEVGDATSASTYYLAEMYYDFSRSLIESERPDDLDSLEKEQYELSIEEQAYPFEEKAIQVYEKNLELMKGGVYNEWVDKSILRLAKLVPARYAKFEESSGFIGEIENVDYGPVVNPPRKVAELAPAGGETVRGNSLGGE